jgi:hypothetical protein
MNGNLIEGVSNGVGAVLQGTVFGLTDTLGKIVGTLGKGVDALGLHLVGGLVTGLGSGLLGLGTLSSKMTGTAEVVVTEVRPRRAVTPKRPLVPFSYYSATGAALYTTLKQAHPDLGPYILHCVVMKGPRPNILLLTQNMLFYVNVDPNDFGKENVSTLPSTSNTSKSKSRESG